jgi:L-lactate dehydrogenase complex protein LldF
MAAIHTEQYRRQSAKAIGDPHLRRALAGLQQRLGRGTAAAYRSLPEGLELRQKAKQLRWLAVNNLDVLLARLAAKIRERGGRVFFAADADQAVGYILETARGNGVKRVVKGKSMVSEEIGLNPALEAAGMEVTETDLGEYIVQLAGEGPSHMIAPAIHKTRDQIGRLFTEKLGIAATDNPPLLTRAARKALREKFLAADMGITGCNLACAETGHIAVVSNEGNIRLCASLPRIHVAVMGMERVTARMEDYDALLRLLASGAAAQKMAGYVSHIGGPPEPGGADRQFHLVILDNGRSRILADPDFREMLTCIRCAGCLNVCPVYALIGGYAYGWCYSGPVGAVVTPLLVGINRAKDLCLGETLCGACRHACPVDIDIPRMLLALRAKLADGDPCWRVKRASILEKAVFRCWSWLIRSPGRYQMALDFTTLAQHLLTGAHRWIRRAPPPLGGWTACRDLPPLARQRFQDRWRQNRPAG